MIRCSKMVVIFIILTRRVIGKNSRSINRSTRLGRSDRHSEDTFISLVHVSHRVRLKGMTAVL